MFNETPETIFERMELLSQLDEVTCKSIAMSCLLSPDESMAHGMLEEVREHLHGEFSAEEAREDADSFLNYIYELSELLGRFAPKGPLQEIREEVRDHYEVLLYNKGILEDIFSEVKRSELVDGFRENYYNN